MTNDTQTATNGTSIAVLVGGIVAVLLVLITTPFGGIPFLAIALAAITIALTFPAYTRAKSTGKGLGLTITGMALGAGALLLIPLIGVLLERS